MLRKAIRKTLRATREWLQEESNHKNNHDADPFLYPWLNSTLMKLIAEGGRGIRPNYAWGVLQGASLAKAIGVNRVSVIEFGVAVGNGLVSLERIAEKVEPIFGIGIDVYGFDTGTGLPPPQDCRDLPNLYTETAFVMDIDKLRKRLQRAQLILGLVESTVSRFIDAHPAPVAFVAFDLDYYSSTVQAFKLLQADQSILLPRIHCYFDDIIGFTHSDCNGERLAIAEFNASQGMRKISPIYGLKHFLPRRYAQAPWSEMFYLAHIFDHDLYGRSDGLVKPATRENSVIFRGSF